MPILQWGKHGTERLTPRYGGGCPSPRREIQPFINLPVPLLWYFQAKRNPKSSPFSIQQPKPALPKDPRREMFHNPLLNTILVKQFLSRNYKALTLLLAWEVTSLHHSAAASSEQGLFTILHLVVMMLLTISFLFFFFLHREGWRQAEGRKVFPTLTVSAVGPVVRGSSSDCLNTRAKTKANKKGHVPPGLRKSRQHGVKK